MTESKGVKDADALMRKLVQVPKEELSSKPKARPAKKSKKRRK